MKTKLKKKNLEELAKVFKILSEPLRLEILQQLQLAECSVNYLVEALACKQPNISKHLAILATANLIQKRKEGTNALYSIKDPFIFELCEVACRKIDK